MIRTALFGCMIFSLIAGYARSQLREKIGEDAIVLAEQCAMELVQRRANLPAKWAALQERDENHLTRIAEFKVGIGKVTEFTAHQQSNKVTLYHVGQQSRIDDPLSTEPPIDW